MPTTIDCSKQGANTGQACVPQMLVLNNYIFVHTFDSSGAPNEVDLTLALDPAYFTARVNDPDPTKRWYPIPAMKNVTNERGDSLYETFADQSKIFINQGTRSFTGLIVDPQFNSPQMLGKIQSFRGVGISVFGVDKAKSLLGKIGSDETMLAPVELQSGSIDAKFVFFTDTTAQKIMVMFDFDMLEDDSQIRIVQASEMTYDISKLRGLIDVTGVISAATTTGFTLALNTDGGTLINPVEVQGLLAADFVSSAGGATSKVRNNTDAADVAITSVVESPAGVYRISYVAQTSGDLLTVKPKKSGFDFSAVEALTITTP